MIFTWTCRIEPKNVMSARMNSDFLILSLRSCVGRTVCRVKLCCAIKDLYNLRRVCLTKFNASRATSWSLFAGGAHQATSRRRVPPHTTAAGLWPGSAMSSDMRHCMSGFNCSGPVPFDNKSARRLRCRHPSNREQRIAMRKRVE